MKKEEPKLPAGAVGRIPPVAHPPCPAPRVSEYSPELLRRGKALSPWLGVSEAADYLGLSAAALNVMRRKGEGPRFYQPSGPSGKVFYKKDDLDAWITTDKEAFDEIKFGKEKKPETQD
jgi:hypothetical protein